MKRIVAYSISLLLYITAAHAATQSDLLNAQLNYQSAKTNYDNSSTNYADAQDDVNQAKINLAQAESALVAAKHDLAYKIHQESQAKTALDVSTGELNKASTVVQNMWMQLNDNNHGDVRSGASNTNSAD